MAATRKTKKKDTSFATWKFELENTVNADPLADGPCLKVLRAYLDWMASPDTRPFLSILTLKVATSLHEGAISRARSILVKLGYFVPDGTTSTGAVRYRILNPRRNIVLDHQAAAMEKLREMDAEKKKRTREKQRHYCLSSAATAGDSGTAVAADQNSKRDCDFRGGSSAATADNYVYNSVESYSYEKEEPLDGPPFDDLNSYSSAHDGDEANQPLPKPRDGAEAGQMIDAICEGHVVNRHTRDVLRRLLDTGILTPNMATNIIKPAAKEDAA